MRSPTSEFPTLFKTALVIVAIALSACDQGTPESDVDRPQPSSSPPAVDAAVPFQESQDASDLESCRQIKRVIEDRRAPQERWGVAVVSLRSGELICGLRTSDLFTPASVLKLLTATAAYDRLGPNFKSSTSVYSAKPPESGVVGGDLVIYGRGAPDFGNEELEQMVSRIRQSGIRRITGNVVGDDSFFKGSGIGDGWTWNELQWYYGAKASALSYDGNEVRIRVDGGKPISPSQFVSVRGDIEAPESIEAIGLRRKLGTNEVYVWGKGKTLDARIAVSNPALFTARVFREKLISSGVDVEGDATYADWTKPTGLENAHEIASIESGPIQDALRTMNKRSVNLDAALITRQLGRRFGKEAPDKNPKLNQLRGEDLAGPAFLEKYLKDITGVSRGIAIHDGSGLSRLNRISPEALVRVLIHAFSMKHSAAFLSTLSIAATDGTLQNRLFSAKGRIRAKTGSIKYVNSLAGYSDRNGDEVAFVIMCNDETDRSDSTATIDSIALEIAGR